MAHQAVRIGVLAAAVLLACSGWLLARAHAPGFPQGAQTANEMGRLHFLLGEWRYVNEYAGGGQDTGTYSARLGPGGQSIIAEFSGSGAAGDFTALEIFTWNPAAKQYEGHAFVSLAPGSSIRYGKWEEDTLVFHRKSGVQEFRYVYKMTGEKELDIELYVRSGEKPFALFLTTRAEKIAADQ